MVIKKYVGEMIGKWIQLRAHEFCENETFDRCIRGLSFD